MRKALLHSGVVPEPLHGGQKVLAERLRVLHPGHHIDHQLGVRLENCEKIKDSYFFGKINIKKRNISGFFCVLGTNFSEK